MCASGRSNEILIQCHIFIYLILGQNERKLNNEYWNNQPHPLRDCRPYALFKVVFIQRIRTRSLRFQNQHHISSIEVRCVCTSLFVYSEEWRTKIWKFKLKPPGSAIVTVRPFFKFQILFLAHFETSWPCTEKYILICKLFPIKKFRNVMKYNFEKRLYHIYSFALKLTFSSSL